jgi:hypothetical protein
MHHFDAEAGVCSPFRKKNKQARSIGTEIILPFLIMFPGPQITLFF